MADEGAEQGTPEHGTPEHGTPEHGTPEHGTPEHGTPEHGEGAALVRLAALQREAAAAYAAIRAADAELRSLAGRRAAGERDLRAAWARYQAASRALATHAAARPGLLAELATGFRAGRRWLAERTELNVALEETAGPLNTARWTLSGVKRDFAAQVGVRAAAVTALRRLTAECEAVLEEMRCHNE